MLDRSIKDIKEAREHKQQMAIENVIIDLTKQNDKVNLFKFMADCQTGQFKLWQLYKQEVGRLSDDISKNRFNTPVRKCTTGKSPNKEMARCNLQKGHFTIGILHDLRRVTGVLNKMRYLLDLRLPTDVLKDYMLELKPELSKIKGVLNPVSTKNDI